MGQDLHADLHVPFCGATYPLGKSILIDRDGFAVDQQEVAADWLKLKQVNVLLVDMYVFYDI